MDWRERFRAPAVVSAAVARNTPERGVVITDVGGTLQAHAWDRETGTLRQVSSADTAVITAAISPDGAWIYAMVDDVPGSELGHLHRFPFDGGEPEDVTPDLDPYTTLGFRPTPTGVIAAGGMAGGPVLIVVDGDLVTVHRMDAMVIGLALSSGSVAAVTTATPGRGLTPTTRRLDLVTGEILHEGPEMQAGAIHDGQVAVGYLDGDWMRPGLWDGSVLEPIEVDVPGDVTPVDWSDDGSRILLFQSHRSKNGLFLYDLASASTVALTTPDGAFRPMQEPSLIGSDRALGVWSDANHPWRVFESTPERVEQALVIEGQRSFPGPGWEEFVFPSTGGVEIQGWLLRPDGDGPWPTVLFTHGGPTSVAGPVFSPVCSAWFDAGFAVASINYRGSITFGQSFREALTGRIGGPDVEDVVAGWRWLVDNGIADPDRVVKNGYSYGGYLTLQSLGTHPDLWAAGVAGAPVADWKMMYEDENDVLRGYQISLFGGGPDELADRYAEASPRSYVSEYRAPVLISQPENDSRTPIRPVRTFVEDMRAHGKQVELHLMRGGHAGSGKQQTIDMVQTWLDFARATIDPPT